ncbi:MAG: choice-of-anchor J domain-containing protein [Bacteroidales bacterium]|nr:choice-of-anchor J domain-containing protein [Bacteroidales bacterium]
MKRVIKNSLLILAFLGVLFTSCKKDYPEPNITDLPIGTVYTIDSILKMEAGTVFNEDASVYGVVTADEKSGNLYKSAFIQDPETNAAIELYLNAKSGVSEGDYIRVYLKGVTYTVYNNLPQLSGFDADGHIIILANGDQRIKPLKATIAEIKANQDKYIGRLVRLENVWFSDQGTFAELTGYGERCLVDASSPTGDKNFIVRTSNYANFAQDKLPSDTGNLVAIASLYKSTWQLIVRSKSDLEFHNYSGGGGGGTPEPPAPAGEVQKLPYVQSFETNFGSYTTYDVSGTQKWIIDFKTAKMTGYEGGVNSANEDWLISSPVDLTGITDAKMTMSYICRYFSNLSSDITVWASTDYTFGNDPTTATWTQMSASLSESSDWNTFKTAEIALTSMVGQTVTFAVKYVSTEQKAGTIEVQSIAIEEGTAGGGGGGGGSQGGDVQSMPYAQSFESEFGTYTTKDVMGSQSWEIDFKTAKMTGYVSNTNYANEDWLISSPVAVTGVSDAKMTMVYIGRYFTKISEDITIWASTDYVFDNDPSAGTWTQVPATFVESSDWNTFQTAEIALTDYVGQTVTFAVKYLSTDTKAGTIEIKSITIQEGTGSTPPGPTPGPTPGPAGGSGTQEDPYNVASGISLQSEEPIAWVQGYIVGAVKAGNTSVSSNDQINWAAPFDIATNVLIADDPACHEISQCVIVNLPAGKPLRTQVNLMDHPENLGKKLAVNGKLRMYFGQAGLRDSGGTENDFVLEGGGTPTPTPTPVPGDAIFSETFANGQGDFEIKDVVLPSDLTYVWIHDSSRKHMKASAFKNTTAYEAESWLVSPAIDLSGVTAATLSFEQAVNYASPTGALSVMISTNYTGNVAEDSWTELEMSAWPAGSDWTFITSTADLTPYVGQTVTIAFKYTSTASASCTWEVKNVVVE